MSSFSDKNSTQIQINNFIASIPKAYTINQTVFTWTKAIRWANKATQWPKTVSNTILVFIQLHTNNTGNIIAFVIRTNKRKIYAKATVSIEFAYYSGLRMCVCYAWKV